MRDGGTEGEKEEDVEKEEGMGQCRRGGGREGRRKEGKEEGMGAVSQRRREGRTSWDREGMEGNVGVSARPLISSTINKPPRCSARPWGDF